MTIDLLSFEWLAPIHLFIGEARWCTGWDWITGLGRHLCVDFACIIPIPNPCLGFMQTSFHGPKHAHQLSYLGKLPV